VALLLIVVVALQFSAVQQKIINAATMFVSDKTHTRVEIGRVAISFPKNIVLEGVFVEDLKHDTLLAVEELSVGADLWGLLKGNIAISEVNLTGAVLRIHRSLSDSAFNFDFLIAAFAKPKDASAPVDTTPSKPLNLQVGDVTLSQVEFTYDDEVSGVYTKNTIGKLSLDVESIDLENLAFGIDEIYIGQSKSVVILKPSSAIADTATVRSVLPTFAVKNIEIEAVEFALNQPGDSLHFTTHIGQLELKQGKVDLTTKEVNIQSLELKHSSFILGMLAARKQSTSAPSSAHSNWKVKASHIVLEQNNFIYQVENKPQLPHGIDYNHLVATNIGLDVSQLFYSNDGIGGDIKQLSVTEQSGITIQKLRTKFIYDGQHAELASLFIQTPHSTISNYISVHYSSLETVGKHPEQLKVNARFKNTKIAMVDVLVFVPTLANNASFAKLSRETITISGVIKGPLNELVLADCIVQTASQTAVSLEGKVNGLPNPEQLRVDLTLPTVTTSRADLATLLPPSTIPTTVTVPAKILAKGSVKGGLKNFQTNWFIQTSNGDIKLEASLNQRSKTPMYKVAVQLTKLDLGAVIQQPILGKMTGFVNLEGASFDPSKMVTTLNSEWTSIELNNYAYSHLKLEASTADGLLHSTLIVKDANIEMNLGAEVSLRAEKSFATVDLKLVGANLKQLHVTPGDYRISGNVKSSLVRLLESDMSGNIGIGGMLVVKEQQRYKIDSLLVMGINEKRQTLDKVNAVCKVAYHGETKLQELAKVLQHTVAKFWGEKELWTDTIPEQFTCVIQVNPHPILSEVLVQGLDKFNGLAINMAIDGKKEQLKLTLEAPLIEYNHTTVNDLKVSLNGKGDSALYAVSLQSVNNEQYFLPTTTLKGNIAFQRMEYDLRIIKPDSGYKLKLAGFLSQHHDTIMMGILRKTVVLNNQNWRVDNNNRIVVTNKGIQFQQFKLENNGRFLSIQSMGKQPNMPVDIQFGNFSLETFSQLIEKDRPLLGGRLNGNIQLNPADQFAFTSDLTIDHVVFNQVALGDLSVKADNQQNRYNATIQLSGNENKVNINGYYEKGNMQFQLSITQLNLRSVEAFIPQTIQRSKGYITGDVRIAGKPTNPSFDGQIGFKGASVNVALLNSRLSLDDESILVNEKGIRFNKFTVRDSLQQPLVIDGSIYTQNFINMQFNLRVTTRKFRVLNTTVKDNKMYYGTLLLNSNISIKGTEKLPKIDAEISLIEGSDLTFVVQQGALSTDKGDGIVEFVDTMASNTIMQDTNSHQTSGFVGLDINANIEVNKNTRFKVITDKESGDNLVVAGDATLHFSIDESGNMTLVGAYILSEGSYKASLQKLVKREFLIKKGSSITWGGDPLDARIDITATYKTKASSTDLLASELAGVPENQRNQYRKLLNYDVNLLMKGYLQKPELSFNLDMPIKDQQAFNGMVYAKVNQINNDPNELNKQVFSLLIMGRFVPMGTGSNVTTGGAVSSIARNSVNQLFSDQLNSISGKYIKGAELNFNLQSNDNYGTDGTTQQNTELQIGLKKELFNNRVTVQVGSNIDVGSNSNQSGNQNLTGDMVMEYKITEDGAYRFKAFRENGYEGIIDGLLYKTGIGFLYSRDYDSVQQLFVTPKKEEEIEVNE
jgi:translocation and assembly module TamB